MLLWGAYVYVDQQDEFSCNRTYGWCKHCAGITAVEDFTNINGQLEQIRMRSAWLKDESASFWHHFICLFSTAKRKYSQSHLDDVNNAVKTITLANKRRGTERCLSCGSNAVQTLKIVDGALQMQNSSGIIKDNFAHPDCGGEFLIENNDIWFSVRGRKKIYSHDGKFVEEILY
jgi:excinuclease UvrABC ATPase subunit